FGFFFQAEDGIRDGHVTGVQTCALPIFLHAQGYNVRVVNAGINGDTTGGMLARLDTVVPAGTRLVILQPGGNDFRKGGNETERKIGRASCRERGEMAVVEGG